MLHIFLSLPRNNNRRPGLLTLFISAVLGWAVLGPNPVGAQQESVQTLTIDRLFANPSLSGPSLRALKVSPAGDRVTFLRSKDNDQDQLDLWEYNILSSKLQLLVDSQQLVPDAGELSAAEKARRERQRIAGLRGIVEYRWSDDGRFLLFPLDGDVFIFAPNNGSNQARRITSTEAVEIDPKISPNGEYVAYVRDHDLYITSVTDGDEKRLTHSGSGTLKNGLAEFIAQEEMGRHSGYWWAPDSQRIAFLQVDESPIPVTKRYEIEAGDIRIIEQRYPYAGKDNVRLRLGVININDGKTHWVDLGHDEDIYIPRVKWLPDSRHLSFQRQSRNQQQLALMVADTHVDDETIPAQTLITETSETWVTLHDDLHFLRQRQAFLWSSERNGFRHLYLYDLDGNLLKQLTDGDWQVDEVESIDENKGWIYFTATAASPLERHLYRQSIRTESPGDIEQLTYTPGTHDIKMDRHGQVFISSFSSRSQPPQAALYRTDGKRLTWLVENDLDENHPYYPYLDAHQATEYGTLEAEDGQLLHYRMIKPINFDPQQQYPVYYYVYGGPTSQTVTNRWDSRVLFEQYMAQQGFIVFSLDNRGTPRRGTKFQAPAYHALGTVEVADQHSGVQYLRSLPYVNGDRIGIFGWSYGGYLTLMSVLKDAPSYALGVAVAPVTDWALYDTHYTERYLGRPQNQPDVYKTANVLNYTQQLKDKLLVIHGMADDNVLFSHTTQLYRRFQDQGILFDTMPYPGAKHRIAGQKSQTHVFRTIAEYFREHLKP